MAHGKGKRAELDHLLELAWAGQEKRRQWAEAHPESDSSHSVNNTAQHKIPTYFSTSTVFAFVLSIPLALIGLVDIFPLYIYALAYAVSLVLILFALWRWESARSLSRLRRSALLAIVTATLIWVFSFPVNKQYDRTYGISLIFKTPASQWDQFALRFQVARMRNYLVSLNIPVPAEVPPIEERPDMQGWEVGSPPHFPVYRGEMAVRSLSDSRQILFDYTAWVIHRTVFPVAPEAGNRDNMILWRSEAAFDPYLVWSFLGNKDMTIPVVSGWPAALWNVRKKFGKDTTDKFVSQALLSIKDNPSEGLAGATADSYLCQKLRIGEGVRDARLSQWPAILNTFADSQGEWVYQACNK